MANTNINNGTDFNSVRTGRIGGSPETARTTWFIEQIYRGNINDRESYHAAIGDMVLDTDGGVLRAYLVTAIDDATKIPTLKPLNWFEPEEEKDQKGVMNGVGPGQYSETWRVFYDNSVEPYTLTVDGKLFIHDSTATHVKIFLGTETDQYAGKVISQYRDQNSDAVSENIPLELIGWKDNIAIKAPLQGHTSAALQDGDQVTVVTYTADGIVLSQDRMLVVNTVGVRRSEVGKKFVTGVSIVSPFLSESVDHQIEFPINMDKEALHMMAQIEYSDGTTKVLAIDGGRLQLHGLEAYEPSVRGAKGTLVLQYNLPDSEDSTIALGNPHRRFISVPYTAITKEVEGAYSVKLYVVPKFVGQEWELEYWLYNLDRDISYNVSELIEAASNSAPFDPRKYVATQRIIVALDLHRVDTSFVRFRHVQAFNIALMGTPTGSAGPFFVGYEVGEDRMYGGEIKGVITRSQNKYYLNIANDKANLNDWLEEFFYLTKPLYNRYSETKAPKPTHVKIRTATFEQEITIEQWNQQILVPNDVPINTTMTLEWIHKTDNSVLYMGISPMLVRNS